MESEHVIVLGTVEGLEVQVANLEPPSTKQLEPVKLACLLEEATKLLETHYGSERQAQCEELIERIQVLDDQCKARRERNEEIRKQLPPLRHNFGKPF